MPKIIKQGVLKNLRALKMGPEMDKQMREKKKQSQKRK
jgi:hypothetical protein